MTQIWSFPTRIVFGEGATQHLGNEVLALGGQRVLIVTDAGVRKAGLLEPLTAALDTTKVEYAVFDGISSNPLEKEVLEGSLAWRESKAEVIVGVGGGSPLDVAKLIALCAHHRPPLAQYDDATGGDQHITGVVPPIIAVPTTAGTGSEVGRSGVVTIESTKRKTVIFSPKLMPSVAILDPALTASLPPRVTAATGYDALTHCIEAYCAKGDHPMADAIALSGIELIAEYLERATLDGKDLAARGAMLKAAMMGAVAFQKGLGACHSLAHPLSAECGLHHGLANALCLPAVVDFNRATVQVRVARIARLLGARGEDVPTLAFECSGALRSLRRKIGLPEGLAAAGVDEEQYEKLARLALEDACHRLNPRECTEGDLLALYRASA
ncbi:MAG: iron-containing alcohol dehydrogenase [Myxococcales bacterium]|nr:iron-containing alcohol dehydrogenase [Myxococcales bacterium]